MPTDCSVCYRPVTTNGFARIFTVLRWNTGSSTGANKPIGFVYFIETGVGSLVNTMANGQAAEVGTIGNEGLVGLPLVFGDDRAPTSVYVQVPGAGLRIKAALLKKELARSASMRTVMLHYAHAFFNQVAQSAACNHFHSLEQRCCRWLLMTHDRMQSDEFLLTQEFLAMMLGVRRTGVTAAAGALQRAGLIRYKRGNVTIIDRRGLDPPLVRVLRRFQEGVRSSARRSSNTQGPLRQNVVLFDAEVDFIDKLFNSSETIEQDRPFDVGNPHDQEH